MEINIPNNLNEITLKQFLDFKSLDFENSDDVFIAKKMINIFCDIPLGIVSQLSLKDFQEITDILTGLLNSKVEFQPRFRYKGVEYGFIPNLDKMSLGEYIDIDNSFRDEDRNSFLQVVYRPITKGIAGKYSVVPYNTDELIDMYDVPYGIYKGAEVFFWNLGSDLLKSMKNYLQNQLLKQDSQTKNILVSGVNGVGIIQLLNSLETISKELNESQKLTYIQPLTICVT